MAVFSVARTETIEPVMVRVSGGWFWMGCEVGRDDEKPPHRVCVDAFELATYQVTNEEYACFLESMMHPQPLCRTIQISTIQRCPSSRYRGMRLWAIATG